MKTPRNAKSGEILTACLIGLAIGCVSALVHYNSYAQRRANETGMEFGASDYFSESPATAIGMPIAGALAGAGVGALIDGFSGKKNGSDSSVRIDAGGDVQYVGRDGSQDQGNKPTTTTTTTTTDRHDSAATQGAQ